MNKLEVYSLSCIQGLLSNSFNDGLHQPIALADYKEMAEMAVSQAKALMEELDKEEL